MKTIQTTVKLRKKEEAIIPQLLDDNGVVQMDKVIALTQTGDFTQPLTKWLKEYIEKGGVPTHNDNEGAQWEILTWSDGKAIIGLKIEIGNEELYFIHKPFYMKFSTDKKVSLDTRAYRGEREFREWSWCADDFPRHNLNGLEYIKDIGSEWVVCKY